VKFLSMDKMAKIEAYLYSSKTCIFSVAKGKGKQFTGVRLSWEQGRQGPGDGLGSVRQCVDHDLARRSCVACSETASQATLQVVVAGLVWASLWRGRCAKCR